ncbi:unnamed protein product [Candidula unifasciata]|uniref:OTU domain-containing protein n=1 Tax=Candidula unifasciata TaxID=100452 RepID=A0A8S3ZS18_9EUPU|nr:unnamed protein product [Candidula unifasciata]
MGKVSVDKLKPALADHFLHRRIGSYFPPRPSLFSHFFRGTDSFINKYLTEGPQEIGSMFPSLFDGIRPGNNRCKTLHLRQPNDDNQQKSGNFRIIPIIVEGREGNSKAESINEANPIVLDDDDEPDTVDITGESSASPLFQHKSQSTFDRKHTTKDSAITVDDDSIVCVRPSSTECFSKVNKAHLKRLDKASPNSKKHNQYKNYSEKMCPSVSNDRLVCTGKTRTNSVITLDDDQETIHIDDIIPDSECSLQQSSDPDGVHKENVSKVIEVEHLESELGATPNRKSTSTGAFSSEVDSCCSLVSLNIEDTDDVNLSNIEVPRTSGLSKTAECCVEELKDSPPPDHPVYEELKTILALENRKIHFITGDGNCFFRALSKILYGCETYHAAVRSLIVDIIATNKSKFAQFVDENDVLAHVQKMSEDHCWATTCEIYAAATVLQRDVYVLTPHPLNKNYSWLLFKPVFKSMHVPVSFAKHLCYITLCNTNGNHYDLVVADHGKCNCFLPCPELDGISASIDLT